MNMETTRETTALESDPALDPTLDHLSRRKLLGRAGAAAASVAAATLTGTADAQEKKVRALDNDTLKKSSVTVPVKGTDGKAAELKAFLAEPEKKGKRGSVIVIHEIFGLNDHIRDVACRFALAGYTALAPDLFTREGEVPSPDKGFGPLMQFVNKIPDIQIIDDLKSLMVWLRAKPTSNKKVGSVGFCWGGRVSMLLDGYAPDLDAAVAYYGRISGQKSDNQPTHPIDLVEKMKAPLLGHFGEKDGGIPPAEADKLREALKKADKKGEIYVYEGANHAFNNDTRESYREDAAKLAMKRTLDWYKKYL